MQKTLAVLLLLTCLVCMVYPLQSAQAAAPTYTFTCTMESGGVVPGTARLSYSYTSVAAVSGDAIIEYGETDTYNYDVNGSYNPIMSVSYNFSSALGLKRYIEFLPGELTFHLQICNPDVPADNYYFSVLDYSNTAEYLEVKQGASNSTSPPVIVGRANLNATSTVSVPLETGLLYTVSVITTRGVISQTFVAGADKTYQIPISNPIEFNQTYEAGAVFTATRNSTYVNYSFGDGRDETASLYYVLYQKVGATETEVWNDTASSFPLIGSWEIDDTTADYVMKAYAYDVDDNELNHWIIPLPAVETTTNPWTSLLAMFNTSDLPFEISQLPALVIVAFVLAIFSYKNHALGCLLAWAIALVMVGIGWLAVSAPAFGFALVLSIFIAFSEAKKTEREL